MLIQKDVKRTYLLTFVQNGLRALLIQKDVKQICHTWNYERRLRALLIQKDVKLRQRHIHFAPV